MKLTYKTISHDDDDATHGVDAEFVESGGSPKGDTHTRAQWDDDCPWSEWYSAEDPVRGAFPVWKFSML